MQLRTNGTKKRSSPSSGEAVGFLRCSTVARLVAALRHLRDALIEVCTAHFLRFALAPRTNRGLHSALAQLTCTAHYYGMSDLLVTSAYIFLLKRGPNPILFLMMHRNDPEIESKAKLMTRACCNT